MEVFSGMSFGVWLEREVGTHDLNRQVEMTFKHVLPGDWVVLREEETPKYLKTGGLVLVGRGVMQEGDQYLVGVHWTLWDEDAKMAGLYKGAPATYDSVRGSAHVSFSWGVQGYRPGDEGSLGGIIRVNGLPMTSVNAVAMGLKREGDTPLDVARQVKDVIEHYHLGNFKKSPGGVQVRPDYWETE